MLNVLSGKEKKRILNALEDQWGCKPSRISVFGGNDLDKHQFFRSDKNKIIIASPSIKEIDLSRLPVNSLGMYFCKFVNNAIRLSIEGSQIIGPHATKGVIEISGKDAEEWLRGENLRMKGETGYFILKNKKDYVGCGRRAEGTISNFVPKERRMR